MRDTFVLYSNYCDILSSTSLEDAGAIFKAILNYVKHGIVIELPPHLTLAFGFIKNQLDIDEEKYNQKVEKLRANGKKRHAGSVDDNTSDLTNNLYGNELPTACILPSEGEENGRLTSHDSPLTSHISPLTSHISPLTNKKDVTEDEREIFKNDLFEKRLALNTS